MEKTRTKFRSSKIIKKLEPLHIQQNSFNEKFQHNLYDPVEEINNDQKKTEQEDVLSDAVTIKKRKQSRQDTGQNQIPSEQNMLEINNVSNQLISPYQFIGVTSPSIRTLVLPHFSFKTIIFGMSVGMLLIFLTIFTIHQIRPQTTTSWGCLLYQTQNKFYPKLKLDYQIWRVFVSAFFHSNFSHLILNLIGLQLYGYFAEWYLGKLKLIGLIFLSIINSHFLSCLTNSATVSTTASGILYSILGVKILFFIKYRNYQQLQSKKYALYGLLGIIFGINIIVLFVGENVDLGGHLGGLLTGLLFGGIFYNEQNDKNYKTVKYVLLSILVLLCLGLIGGTFGIQRADINQVNNLIDTIC